MDNEDKINKITDKILDKVIKALVKIENEENVKFAGVSLIRQVKDDSWNTAVFKTNK